MSTRDTTKLGCEIASNLDAVTYSLVAGTPTSERYYADIRKFTDEVIGAAKLQLDALVTDFNQHQVSGRQQASTQPEMYLELLTLGLYWRIYGPVARRVSPLTCKVLATLGSVRCQGGAPKKASDWLKGIILTLVTVRRDASNFVRPTLAFLNKLLNWLASVGDFQPETQRLRTWQLYLSALPESEFQKIMSTIQAFTTWFEVNSRLALGRYTVGVNPYLEKVRERKRWHEDLLFCSKSQVEYHLNMVGAEILNRAFRPEFLNCAQYELLVPGCMRAKGSVECQARRSDLGLSCTRCTANCRVNQLSRLGVENGFEVYIASHESDVLAKGGALKLQRESIGVIGVACVPNLISGGWKLRNHNIPAQCVLLECSGCKKHWCDSGVATNINFHEVDRILTTGNTNSIVG